MTDADQSTTVRGVQRRFDLVPRRLQVIDAFLHLVLEDGTSPDPASVAERASVWRAPVFRNFAALDEQRNKATGRVSERFIGLFELGEPSAWSSQARVFGSVESA